MRQHPFIERLFEDRTAQYWALQLFGWSGYAFFVALSAFLWGAHVRLELFYTTIATLSGFVASVLLREYLHRIWYQPQVRRGLLILVGVGVATALWSWIKMEGYFYLLAHEGKTKGAHEYLSWFTYSFFILLSWTGLYFGIKYYQMLQTEKRKSLRAMAMAHEAQLKMLRYQLNPHFLFNTLNAISTLVLEQDTKTANAMVTELSKFLRYSLDNDPMQKVTLSQEVKALQLYLGIEKLRFEERLQVEIDISEAAKRANIPSLLLQPLVENSLKYAIAASETGGTIQLRAQVFARELLLELSDTGPGMPISEGQPAVRGGVGLVNTEARLKEIYGDNHSIQYENLEPRGLKISLRIPYEEKEGA